MTALGRFPSAQFRDLEMSKSPLRRDSRVGGMGQHDASVGPA